MENTPSKVFLYINTLFVPWQPDLQTLEILIPCLAFVVDKGVYQMVK
jgi:hypothetical protein